MILLNPEPVTVQARTQSVVNGRVVFSANGAPVSVLAAVQPAPKAMIEVLPEASRRSAMWAVYFEAAHLFDLMPSGSDAAPPLISTAAKGDLVPVAEAVNTSGAPGDLIPHTVYVCAEDTSK